MVAITNGSRNTIVTRGVFEAVYKPNGWHEIGPESNEKMVSDSLPEEELKAPEIVEDTPAPQEEEAEDILMDETEVEIPLSEMKMSELRSFADEHSIDVSAAKNKKGMIDIIRSEL